MPRLAASIATRKAAGDLPTWSLRAPATDRDRGDKSWSRVTQLCIFRFAVIPRVVAQLAYNFAVSERVCEYMTHLLCTVCDPRRPSGRRRPPFAPRRTSAVRCEDVSGNETHAPALHGNAISILPYVTTHPFKCAGKERSKRAGKERKQPRNQIKSPRKRNGSVLSPKEWSPPIPVDVTYAKGCMVPNAGRCQAQVRVSRVPIRLRFPGQPRPSFFRWVPSK
jgi:hypothetical protein